MGLIFRKRITLGKFLRLNLSKRGVGVSVGKAPFTMSTGPAGERMTLSVPGTGLSYRITGKGRAANDEGPRVLPRWRYLVLLVIALAALFAQSLSMYS